MSAEEQGPTARTLKGPIQLRKRCLPWGPWRPCQDRALEDGDRRIVHHTKPPAENWGLDAERRRGWRRGGSSGQRRRRGVRGRYRMHADGGPLPSRSSRLGGHGPNSGGRRLQQARKSREGSVRTSLGAQPVAALTELLYANSTLGSCSTQLFWGSLTTIASIRAIVWFYTFHSTVAVRMIRAGGFFFRPPKSIFSACESMESRVCAECLQIEEEQLYYFRAR